MHEELTITEKDDGSTDVSVGVRTPSADVKEFTPLLSFFGIEGKISGKESTELQAIWDHLKEETDTSIESNIYTALRNYEERLATPRIGERRIGKLYNYVKARQAVKNAEKDRDSLLR